MCRADGSRTFEMLSTSFEEIARCWELIGRRRTLVAAVGCNAQDQCTPFELAELALAAVLVAFAVITNTVQGRPGDQVSNESIVDTTPSTAKQARRISALCKAVRSLWPNAAGPFVCSPHLRRVARAASALKPSCGPWCRRLRETHIG
jgi:hypothetical protein